MERQAFLPDGGAGRARPGSGCHVPPEEVRAEVRERAATLGQGGGYILQSTHTMLFDVPLANLVAYVEEVRALAGLETPRPNGQKD